MGFRNIQKKLEMYVALSSFHEEFKSQFVVGTAYGNRPNFFSRAHLETRPKVFSNNVLWLGSFYATENEICVNLSSFGMVTQFRIHRFCVLFNVLMKYEGLKMKREARQKCSLFLSPFIFC